MLKQIPISDLFVDMYIAQIIETPGVPMPKKKRGMIRDPRIISKFIEIGIQEVVIDTEKGLDVLENTTAFDALSADPDRLSDQEIEAQMSELKKQMATGYQDLALEWGNAKEIFKTSVNIMDQSIKAIKNDKKINPEYFNEAGKAISRSIMRNKDALTWLGKLRTESSYLYEHSVNTSILMGIFANAYGLKEEQVEQCITGALVHDLGQAHIQAEFFVREGPLSPEEFEQVKEHVNFGVRILANNEETDEIVMRIVHEHHERYDGSGYPNGLKRDEISLVGRMFAIVDTYDAVTNKRSYSNAIASSDGMRTLLNLSREHFDEGLVHQFIKCLGVYPTGSLVKLNNGLLAVVIAQNLHSPLKPVIKTIYSTKKKTYTDPQMLDLMKKNMGEKISSYEDPTKYEIKINDFMPEEIEL